MTNLITNSEKSRGNNAVALLLPFERYVQSITNLEERKRLCDTCKQAIGIRSDTQLWNYRVGNVRPDMLKRRELANCFIVIYDYGKVYTHNTMTVLSLLISTFDPLMFTTFITA